MPLNKNHLEEFEGIINYPLIKYFNTFILFFQNDYQNIVDYYSGSSKIVNSTSFSNLKILLSEIDKIFNLITLNKNRLNNYSHWEIIEQIEENHSRLLTIDNLPRWLRSTISKNNFNPNPEVDVALKQNQTLEHISRNILGSENSNDDWLELALKNDLEEESYTSEGGLVLKANYNNDSQGFEIQTIVDTVQGEKILGIDLDKKITFDSDENDLKVLSPRETFIQSVRILSNLKQGDNPENPDDGINDKLTIGSNVNAISFPILFKQLIALFSSDDTFSNFTIISIKREQDGVFLEFSVQSRLNENPSIISSLI